MNDFTEKLKKIIEDEGLTASKFAEKIGVQRSSVSHVLSGRNKPSLDFILKINKSIDESSYLLGHSKLKTFSLIHIPYLKKSVFLIGILITVEIIRELPLTLILRPYNFETFATQAYIYASQDLLEAAAAPSLFLILIASFFILITSRYILKD